MPPRTTRAAQKNQANGISNTAALTAVANPGTSLLEALDHVPPAPPGPALPRQVKEEAMDEDDDLTPPPSDAAPNGVNGDHNTPKSEVKPEVPETNGSSSRKRGRGKQFSYAEHPEEAFTDMEVDEDTKSTPAKGKGKKKAAKKVREEEEDHIDSDNLTELDEEDAPKTTPKKRAKKKTKTETDGEETPAKVKKVTPKKSRLAKDEPEFDEEGNEIVKKKKRVKVYPKIEYDIPGVEKKTTTFKGRLGYACLNTVLRSTKPDSIFCSRTCRIASIEEEGMELPKGLALLNVKDLVKMIEWNEQNNIRFLRLSSEMFPFASHDKYGYDLSFADAELKEAGALANKYGHRITMHPGQFTQIGSPKPNVVTASVRELDYQCEILDRMGIDHDGVMIIHMGGIYGDKESTLARFKENFKTRLSEKVQKRLVLENDEICYNVDDIFPVCDELNIPIIFDYHHDWIYPSAEPPSVLIPKIAEIWKRRGIKMKQHLSEPRPGAESVMERRAHADRCQNLPPDLPDDVDLMIEAKDKEQAVFELYRMYDLHPVIWDNLRPPDKNPSMQTTGRKSSLKKKVKDTGLLDEDGNPVQLEDVEKEGDGGLGDEGDAAIDSRTMQEGTGESGDDKSAGSTPQSTLGEKPKRKRGGKAAAVIVKEESMGEGDAKGKPAQDTDGSEAVKAKKATPKKRKGKAVAKTENEEVEEQIEAAE